MNKMMNDMDDPRNWANPPPRSRKLTITEIIESGSESDDQDSMEDEIDEVEDGKWDAEGVCKEMDGIVQV